MQVEDHEVEEGYTHVRWIKRIRNTRVDEDEVREDEYHIMKEEDEPKKRRKSWRKCIRRIKRNTVDDEEEEKSYDEEEIENEYHTARGWKG